MGGGTGWDYWLPVDDCITNTNTNTYTRHDTHTHTHTHTHTQVVEQEYETGRWYYEHEHEHKHKHKHKHKRVYNSQNVYMIESYLIYKSITLLNECCSTGIADVVPLKPIMWL